MEVENLNGYLGVVAASPRNGKWLVVDGDKSFRVSEDEIREFDPSWDRHEELEDPAYHW